MVYTSRSLRRASLLVSSVAALGLLSACGNGTGVQAGPEKVTGTAAPATENATGGDESASPSAAAPDDSSPSPSSAPTGGTAGESSGGGTKTATSTGTRCHTSELGASVGRNNPGAGQENFPIVLTNKSGRTCTLHGYPGAAFVNASGGQLGPDPKRSSGSPATVTLKPGQSAWAGLTFSNPEISGAKTATPAALLVTPPDERDSLKVTWTAGTVPVSGNSSSVFLTVFSPGTGA
ncbi:DUF4232 domain-containing protein [Streptomyces brasiliensis]|uniref:Lipoprotein n=1 Tax=Streptomyces brasiliensis TaxID=1954 RepID=A0A917K318_9ACTN|nr:DUF4232 domain-containing protein [Streptomyces brasiliensis]GGI97129.1 lipoprotein [Streptomyces brasiliensis]